LLTSFIIAFFPGFGWLQPVDILRSGLPGPPIPAGNYPARFFDESPILFVGRASVGVGPKVLLTVIKAI
jgi:hypothetical protein